MSVSNGPEPAVDVSYRKVGDGHPLRLWRVSTEVEAPPGELLQRVLRERHCGIGKVLSVTTMPPEIF